MLLNPPMNATFRHTASDCGQASRECVFNERRSGAIVGWTVQLPPGVPSVAFQGVCALGYKQEVISISEREVPRDKTGDGCPPQNRGVLLSHPVCCGLRSDLNTKDFLPPGS